MDSREASFLKNAIAVWLEGHQDDVHPLSLALSAVSGSSLVFQANSRHIHMIVPSVVAASALDLPPSSTSSEEVFIVTAPEDPDSDPRFNSALIALNEKLERLRPDAADALYVAMEYLVAAMKKFRGKSSQSSGFSAHQLAHSVDDDTYMADDGDVHGDHDDDGCDLDEEDDDYNYNNADEVDFGYDIAFCEDANRGSTASIDTRSKGFLYAMAIDAKQQCDRARQRFSSPPDTSVREDQDNSVLAWCSLEPIPGDLAVRIGMQVGGIMSDDAAAASLGLPLDFPVCILLEFNKDHWCRKEFNRPLKVDSCAVKAMETTAMKAADTTENMMKEEGKQFVMNLDKRHRFGEDIFLPELVGCYFRFLEMHDGTVARSADILEDLALQAAKKNVFVGLLCFLAARLRALPNWCIVCWNTLPFNVGRLRTCDGELCLYRFEELGLGTTVLQEVQKYPELFDFEVSLAFAALESERDVFEPFPAFLLEGTELRGRSGWFSKKVKVDNEPVRTVNVCKPARTHGKHMANKQLSLLRSILRAYPSADDMRRCADEVELKKMLTTLWQKAPKLQDAAWKDNLWLPYDVLRFLLSTSRLTMHFLQGSEALREFKCALYQFAVLHDSPEKEAYFEKRKKEMGGSFFAFHGSATGNWYSILRNGLRSMSNTAYMSTGAAHGAGIYTADDTRTSFGFARAAAGWKQGRLHDGFSVMAICEIVKGSVLPSMSNGIMVVPPQHEQDILIRYILVFSHSSSLAYHSTGICITSTTLGKQSSSTDLLHHHQWVREIYHQRKQSEWKVARNVRWASMKAMCAKNKEEELEQTTRASLGANPSCGMSSTMPGCIRAIQKELRTISNQISAAKRKSSAQNLDGSMLAGIEIDLPNESDLRRWHVLLSQHVFRGCPLYDDLANHAKHNKKASMCVKLECVFPDTFPMAPPFVRVVSPKFKFHTGHVTVGGSICMELLTESGWSPAFCFESVLVQIISAMMEGGARLDCHSNSEYSVHEAQEAFDRVARDHGWIKSKGAL